MIVERSMSPEWLSNTWLVADGPGGKGVLIDTGGPPEPILERIAELELTVTHALCTHHHHDHVANNALYRDLLKLRVCGHRREAALFGGLDGALDDGEVISAGDLRVRVLWIPGHTVGQAAFVVNDERVFTGDTLFRGSVGGTRAAGHATFAGLKRSIMEVLMKLPPGMEVHPGHMESTRIGEEWEKNPFIRMWRGLDPPGSSPCVASGKRATLLLRARDYDGGTKCWVRWDDGGEEDVLPGSLVREPDV
ncbi:MAG: MBL fold metallo-hydrolase [Acidobacteria bacterium]|nr:MBL fold metallo-hydrolase [Acidobacteriota bacterium]